MSLAPPPAVYNCAWQEIQLYKQYQRLMCDKSPIIVTINKITGVVLKLDTGLRTVNFLIQQFLCHYFSTKCQ